MMMMMELGWWEHERELRSGNHKGWRWEDTGDYIYFFKNPSSTIMWKRDGVYLWNLRGQRKV